MPPFQKYSGLLLLDKPLGMTSHQAVGFLRRKLKMKQIGHAGTLDPLATGLLVLMVGKATKTSQYLVLDNKIYQGTIKLGEISNTFDSEGRYIFEKVARVSIPMKIKKAHFIRINLIILR